jgi:hypothetical protein
MTRAVIEELIEEISAADATRPSPKATRSPR